MSDKRPKLVLPIEERDHTLGPRSARYSLVEYGDYESDRSRTALSAVRQLVRELGDDLCFAYRNFPQPDKDPRSRIAAEAAEAAGFQGKFWLMHDRIFDHSGELSDQVLRELAEDLPIELETFERDLSNGEARDRVNEDLQLAAEDGVGATPTFFVNGSRFTGEHEFLPMLAALKGPEKRE